MIDNPGTAAEERDSRYKYILVYSFIIYILSISTIMHGLTIMNEFELELQMENMFYSGGMLGTFPGKNESCTPMHMEPCLGLWSCVDEIHHINKEYSPASVVLQLFSPSNKHSKNIVSDSFYLVILTTFIFIIVFSFYLVLNYTKPRSSLGNWVFISILYGMAHIFLVMMIIAYIVHIENYEIRLGDRRPANIKNSNLMVHLCTCIQVIFELIGGVLVINLFLDLFKDES